MEKVVDARVNERMDLSRGAFGYSYCSVLFGVDDDEISLVNSLG